MSTPREAIAEWFGGDEPYNHADSVILALRRSGWDITPLAQRHNPDESAVLFLALHCEGWTWTLDADDVADDVVGAVNAAVGDDQRVTVDGIFVPQWMTTEGQIRLLSAMRVDATKETP